MIMRLAIVLCALPLLMSAATPIQNTVKGRSNPSAAKLQKRTGSDAAFNQSSFGRNLVNKVKKGAIYIWAMTPGDTGVLQERWIGSGFIFQADPANNAAYALTNHHVANDTTLL